VPAATLASAATWAMHLQFSGKSFQVANTMSISTDSVYARLSSAEDELKRLRLRQMRWLATGLLIGVTVLYGVSVVFARSSPAWPFIGAFAEAAMVGALADWFAVTALFRHPLGLSFIPHTAIIPKNKNRIADNLGDFVQGEFFSTERVTNVIRAVDPAARAAQWLADEKNADLIGSGAVKLLSYGLTLLDNAKVRAFLRKTVADKFADIDLSTLAGQILQALTHDGRHQAVLDQMLTATSKYLNDESIKHRVAEFLADKIPLYFKSWKDSTANYAIEKLLDFLGRLLDEVDRNADHPLRAEFDRAVWRLIARLKDDPAFRDQIRAYQRQLAANEVLIDYIDGLWRDFNAWLRADIASGQSAIRARLSGAVSAFGAAFAGDAGMQQVVNEQILLQVPRLLDRFRPKLGVFIASKMKEWKEHEVVEKLELNIGRDLQFIRLNGTLVGGCVGLAIHALTVWLH